MRKRHDFEFHSLNKLSKEIIDAIDELTEFRYEDPTFVGEECVLLKNGIVKMRVESWGYECVAHAANRGLKIEDCDEEILRQWQREEAQKGFSLLNDLFDFDPHVGAFGQHFAFFFKPTTNLCHLEKTVSFYRKS